MKKENSEPWAIKFKTKLTSAQSFLYLKVVRIKEIDFFWSTPLEAIAFNTYLDTLLHLIYFN